MSTLMDGRAIVPSAKTTQETKSSPLAAALAERGRSVSAREALDCFKGIAGLVGRKEHLTKEGGLQTARLGMKLALYYEQNDLRRQSHELYQLVLDVIRISQPQFRNHGVTALRDRLQVINFALSLLLPPAKKLDQGVFVSTTFSVTAVPVYARYQQCNLVPLRARCSSVSA